MAMSREATRMIDRRYQVRWMLRRDLPEILAIESQGAVHPYCEEDYLVHLRDKKTIGMTTEDSKGRIIGGMVYELEKNNIKIFRFIVASCQRRQGVGTEMIKKLIAKLSSARRYSISISVPETCLGMQLFFKQMQFTAIGVNHGQFSHEDDGTDEDGYQFEYQIGD